MWWSSPFRFPISPRPGDDLILCQITSQQVRDRYAIPLTDQDFQVGGLRQTSNIRPSRLFTADERIVLYAVGRLNRPTLQTVVTKLVEILER